MGNKSFSDQQGVKQQIYSWFFRVCFIFIFQNEPQGVMRPELVARRTNTVGANYNAWKPIRDFKIGTFTLLE